MARHEKVASAIQREVSSIIHDELKDPRLGFVTITGAQLTPDLRYCKIFFSVLGKAEDYAKTKRALDSALGYIRKLVGQRILLRLVPELSFYEDKSGEYSVRIQQVLDEIKELEATTKVRKEAKGEPKKSSRVRKKK